MVVTVTAMAEESTLAEFLRARRAAVGPAEVGISDVGPRRVPGLRREELALLAGVSVDYYTRLEQGRDRNPSPEILSALAGPLQLDHAALDYAKRLAELAPRRRASGRPEHLLPGMHRVLDALVGNPVYVTGRYRDILASNRLAAALNPGFAVGRNLLGFAFLDPAARAVYPDWDAVASEHVATLRSAIGANVDDARFRGLVNDLLHQSPDFGRLWGRLEVRHKGPGFKRFTHPLVGILDLDYDTMAVNGTEGQTLVVYHAEPGGHDAQALAQLASTL